MVDAGLLVLAVANAEPIWKVFCAGQPLFRGRLDPLIQPGSISLHVHKVAGANHFSACNTSQSPEDVYNQLVGSSCTTCSIKKVDSSQYWFPDLYYTNPDGSFSLVPDGGLTVYYLSRAGSGNQSHPHYTAFPKGFRMVSGSPFRRDFNASSTADLAISYACLGNPSSPEMNRFPTDKYFCSNGLRAQVFFPMCWDGVNIDSHDHKSHMAFPTTYNDGDCPLSHPVRVPGLFYEAFYSVDKFPHGKGTNPFVWSCGDPTGYGFHGDFLSGWDPVIMQKALEDPSCDSSNPYLDDGNNVTACRPLAQYVQDTPAGEACYIEPRIPLTEDMGIGHPIPTLPGCNPITQQTSPPCTAPIAPSKSKYPRYLFKSQATGKYVSANPPGTSNPVVANVQYPTLSEVWDPNPVDGGVSLMSELDGMFASANGDNGMLWVNRGSVSTWETFKLVQQPGGYIAIQSVRNNLYITVTPQGNLVPTSNNVTMDCLFTAEAPDGGAITLPA